MSKIQFRNAAHRDFVLENLDKCKVNDCYHRAFFYVMGISEETRMNIGKMFDLRGIASYRKVCTAVGRQVAQSRFATLPLISGMDLRKKAGKSLYTGGTVLLRICSVFYGGYQVEVSGVLQRFDST